MRKINDQVLAKRMLQIRGEGGYRVGMFLRFNAGKYILYVVIFIVALASLAAVGMWIGFSLMLGLFLGSLLRNLGWIRASRRNWPFTMRVINWNLVDQLAAKKPPADAQARPDARFLPPAWLGPYPCTCRCAGRDVRLTDVNGEDVCDVLYAGLKKRIREGCPDCRHYSEETDDWGEWHEWQAARPAVWIARFIVYSTWVWLGP